MQLIKKILPIGFLGMFVASCGMSHRTFGPAPEQKPRSQALRVVSEYDEVNASLMQAYRDWKGTPYRLGGDSSSGVDCSSLVRIIFDEYFDIELPPTTVTQLNAGAGVRRTSLKTGDLVFFKTGRKTLHVGIIIKNNEFLHASTSNGVMISRLDERYWSSRYLAARRVM